MSEHKTKATVTAESSGIVVGDGKHHRHYTLHLKLVATIVVALVVLGGIIWGGVALYDHHKTNSQSKPSPKPKESVTAKEAPLTPTQHSEQLASQGQYAQAQSILSTQISKTTDKETQASLYSQQVTTALNAQNYTDAKTYAQKAEKIEPTASTAYQLGYVSELQGDKQAAKMYYQEAIDRQNKLPQTNASQLILRSYQNQLQGVGQ